MSRRQRTRSSSAGASSGDESFAQAKLKEKILAATGPLLSAPLLYSDPPSMSRFVVVARGKERSTQFVGLVGPGYSRVITCELEPTARKILDGVRMHQLLDVLMHRLGCRTR